jgi:hypothetical protein
MKKNISGRQYCLSLMKTVPLKKLIDFQLHIHSLDRVLIFRNAGH